MSKPISGAMLTILVDSSSRLPLFRQLYEQIRNGILEGRIAAKARLPASRTLAGDIGVSRNTVLNAYDELIAEGYLEAKVGSGTRVVSTLPDAIRRARQPHASPRNGSALDPTLSERIARRWPSSEHIARRWPSTPGSEREWSRPLLPGNPDLSAFPRELWARLTAKHWRNMDQAMFGYGDPMGYEPLRHAIADYVSRIRAVHCDAKQVFLVGGSQQALHLCAQVFLDPSAVAWVEDPGYPLARAAFISAGAQVVPVPVDREGLIVSSIKTGRRNSSRLIYVTPSHQCPLGVMMSLPRRLELLDFAARTNAWIVEDDYNSEYRYFNHPLTALHSLDKNGRVIYVGTVSKTLIPGLRIGYMVLPEPLIDAFIRARVVMDRQPAIVDQAVLAEFISEGWLERHIRRARVRYMERQEVLIQALYEELPNVFDVTPNGAGMYLIAYLKNGLRSADAVRRADAHGVTVISLSSFSVRYPRPDGLVLGYGAYTPDEIRGAVRRLSLAFRERRRLMSIDAGRQSRETSRCSGLQMVAVSRRERPLSSGGC